MLVRGNKAELVYTLKVVDCGKLNGAFDYVIYYIVLCFDSYLGLKHMNDLLKTDIMTQCGAYYIDEKYPTRKRLAPEAEPLSEDYMKAEIDHNTHIICHPAGSCKMGASGDPAAVVDPQLK